MATKTRTFSPTVSELADSFERALRASNKAPKTIKAYLGACVLLDRLLADRGMPREAANVTREHV
jgi:hypothetical protein